jgi:single-strand DNA-binding protein
MLNRVILIGRVATDPEMKYTPSGVAVVNFRIAVDRPVASSKGERETDFINIVAWRQNAEFAANYLNKGRLIAVDGSLRIRQWTTQDGQKRTSAEVNADRLTGLDKPRQDQERGAAEPSAEAPPNEPEAGPFDNE